VEELDVGGCAATEALALLDAAPLLHTLGLGSTALPLESLRSLWGHPRFGSLRSLHLDDAQLCGVGASRTEEGVKTLCEALSRPNALRSLGLAGNGFCDEDARTLARACDGSSLVVDLRRNPIWEPEHTALPREWAFYPPGANGGAIGVDKQVVALMEPDATIGPSSSTHNIITVSAGVLIVSVKFGTGGDDDQHLGVLSEEAPKGASYDQLRSNGWIIKDSNTPWVQGRPAESGRAAQWKLKGQTITMVLDLEARAVSFWAEDGQTFTHRGLPKGQPLTAALSLYQNTATVTGLRHVLPKGGGGASDGGGALLGGGPADVVASEKGAEKEE